MLDRSVFQRLHGPSSGALFLALAVLALGVPTAHAQSSWNGGTGDWSVPGNWTPNGVPNSPTTDVTITGTSSIPSSVALDNFSPTVHNLSLDSFSTLSLSAANLYVEGPSLSNAGHVNVGSGSFLGIQAPTVNLTGGGTVNLNTASSEINGSNTSLVNKDNTIQGQGYIINLSNFTNQATVNANVSGGALSIGVYSGITNTGILEATGGGTLFIGSSYTPTVTNTNGTISTDGSSTVYLNSAAIIGGNLTSASGAEIHGLSGTALNG
ncbi:MAG TPA: hypothetical protein VJY33_02040, partial [Isosphaeraceae bacterium]|nr:hypothetical protein [Isosphaeraceae bacterium]